MTIAKVTVAKKYDIFTKLYLAVVENKCKKVVNVSARENFYFIALIEKVKYKNLQQWYAKRLNEVTLTAN